MMRLSFLLQLAVGALMAGCTYNSVYSISTDSGNNTYHFAGDESVDIDLITTKVHCERYVPIPAPRPIEVDIEAVKNAKSEEEINKILLKNIEELHKQMKNHASRQKDHFRKWVDNCLNEKV